MKKISLIFAIFLFKEFCASQNSLFETQPNNENKITCCVCIPFYACINGKLDMAKFIAGPETREQFVINVNKCENHLDFCCKISNDLPERCRILGQTPPDIILQPKPKINCECMSYKFCPLNNIITDGKGNTSDILSSMGLPGHSKCNNMKTHVCCKNEDFSMVGEPKMFDGNSCICVNKDMCSENVYTYGDGLLQPRLGNNNNSQGLSACPGNTLCCPPSEIITNKMPSSSTYVYLNQLIILYSIVAIIIRKH